MSEFNTLNRVNKASSPITHKKTVYVSRVGMLLIIIWCFWMLAYEYIPVQSAGLSIAQQLTPTPQPPITPQSPTLTLQDVAQELERLRIRVDSELVASRTGIETMKEANDRNFQLFAFLSGIAVLISIVLGISTWLKGRRESQDYHNERKFYEERATRDENRRQAEHGISLQFYEQQIKARREENEHAGRMSGLQEVNLRDVNAITTAIAAGARENVTSLNTILSTFQQIMEFKVEEAKDARLLMQQMQNQLNELQEAQRQQVEELLRNAVKTRRSRFLYTNPDPDLRRQLIEFRTQMDLMQTVILDRYTGLDSPAENRQYGEIYVRRGVIAYYDNDMSKSREMLRIAERFFPFSDDLGSAALEHKRTIAFIQFYLALIEKNYGEMTAARDCIEKSYSAHGRNEPAELLTPVTRAEILSYLDDMESARTAIAEVLDRANNIQQRGPLHRHDATYALRARLLLGNTYYVESQWEQALHHYSEALRADVRQDNIYYIHHSLAQVHSKLGNVKETREHRQQAYDELMNTGHLRSKVSLDTQITLNSLAYLCIYEDQAELAREYQDTIRELWLRIHETNGLQLRIFSFEKKRPINKDQFWAEVFTR